MSTTGPVRRRTLLGAGIGVTATALGACARPQPPAADLTAALPAAIEDHLRSGSLTLDAVRGVAMSVHGKTVLEHYRHGFSADRHEHVWSITKSVVATLVGAALADGALTDLDQTLAELLPEHRRQMSPTTRALTLRLLMSMSAGVSSDLPTWSVKRLGRGDLVGLVLRHPPAAEPGERFVYSNLSAHLIAAALRQRLRSRRRAPSLLAYARERLLDPLGIVTRPAYEGGMLQPEEGAAFAQAGFAWAADAQGVHFGCFGLRLTVPDLVKLGELHRRRGSWGGRALFDPRWVEQLTTPALTSSTYGLLWWLTPFGSHRAYSALGSGGQLLVVVPDLDAVVAIVSANDAERPINAPEALFPLVNDVLLPAAR